MITFTNTIRINRPVEDVYDYLSDIEHTPEWNWAITETKKTTPGPIDVGTKFLQTRTTPRPATETIEITALEPHRHIEIEGTLADLPASLSYDLIGDAAGTDLANTVNLEPSGMLRLAAPLLGPRIKHAVASNLNDLKILLEASG